MLGVRGQPDRAHVGVGILDAHHGRKDALQVRGIEKNAGICTGGSGSSRRVENRKRPDETSPSGLVYLTHSLAAHAALGMGVGLDSAVVHGVALAPTLDDVTHHFKQRAVLALVLVGLDGIDETVHEIHAVNVHGVADVAGGVVPVCVCSVWWLLFMGAIGLAPRLLCGGIGQHVGRPLGAGEHHHAGFLRLHRPDPRPEVLGAGARPGHAGLWSVERPGLQDGGVISMK